MEVKKANMNNNDLHEGTVFNNGQLMFVDNLKEMSVPNIIRNEIWLVILVLDGQATFSIKEKMYKAVKNDMFICLPNMILEQCMTSITFRCHCVGMSSNYVLHNFPVIDNSWDLMALFTKNPLVTLTDSESRMFCQYYDLLCSKIHLPSIVQEKVINTLMLAFLYDLQYLLDRVTVDKKCDFSSKEYHFRRFIDLLDNSYPKNRTVTYYSDKLNITTKYFATLCKQIAGSTPSHIIDEYVLNDIDYLMRYTTKSIKEIASELDFPNISFFGKYVRRHWGMSPKAYRMQCFKQQLGAKLDD